MKKVRPKLLSSFTHVEPLAPVSLSQENGFSVRVVGQSPGKTSVSVVVNTNPTKKVGSRQFTNEIQVTVQERMQLETPSTLLLPPHATYQIRTNMDRTHALNYYVCGELLAIY